MRLKFGEPCPKCGSEVVRISRETLSQIIEVVAPKFYSVSKAQINGKRKYIPICPGCDGYALGGGFEEGFPFIMKDGRESEIQQIMRLFFEKGLPFRSCDLPDFVLNQNDDINDKAEAVGAKIIGFPRYTVPQIDWNEIEDIRKERYPDLPVGVIHVLKKLMIVPPTSAEVIKGDYSFQFHSYTDDIYPPDSVPMIPGKACTIWLMDLLDRFGGSISFGELTCEVERDEVKHPIFLMQQISKEQLYGINHCLNEYEFYAKNKFWEVFSKSLNDYNLSILIAKDLSDKSRVFQILFDCNTYLIAKERILEGKQAWDEILLIK